MAMVVCRVRRRIGRSRLVDHYYKVQGLLEKRGDEIDWSVSISRSLLQSSGPFGKKVW